MDYFASLCIVAGVILIAWGIEAWLDSRDPPPF